MKRRRWFICLVPTFKPGDQPPDGYLAWHEWARVQARAGLRSTRRACGYYHFPQERCAHEKTK